MLKLHTYWRSSASYRARIALALKGVEYLSCATSLPGGAHRSPQYLLANPQGLVPALDVDGQAIGQSLALIEFLDETYPDPPLLPRDRLARAQVRWIAQAIACDIHPLNNLRVLRYLRDPLGCDETQVDAWYRHWVALGFAALEELVSAATGDRRHCVGSSVTLADVCLVPQVYNARRYACDLSPYPTLVAIDAALRSIGAFAAAAPEAQPDATT